MKAYPSPDARGARPVDALGRMDHVLAVAAPDGDTHAMGLLCAHCGHEETLKLPLGFDVLLGATGAFQQAHNPCPVPAVKVRHRWLNRPQ